MKKKAQINNIILLVGLLFILLIAGLFLVFGSMIINWVFDEAVPELSSLGMVGSSNLSQVADVSIVPVNNLVQSFTWLSGVFYVLGLIG